MKNEEVKVKVKLEGMVSCDMLLLLFVVVIQQRVVV